MQKLAEVCVRRPVFASMLIAAIIVIGGVSLQQLGIDRYPRIETPVVSVMTMNPGATPESVEKEITDIFTAGMPTLTVRSCARAAATETAISRMRWNRLSKVCFSFSIVSPKGARLSA